MSTVKTSGKTAGFNPRPHTAGDGMSSWGLRLPGCFNPRPHTAGDGGWMNW